MGPKPFAGMRVEVKRVLSFASYLIGRIAIGLGGPAHAIAWFRRAVRFQESSTRALSWLGWSLAEAGAIEEAAAVYDNLVKLRPADARSWLGVARAKQELGKHIDALSALDHAIALERQNPFFHYTRGQSLIALGRIEEAASAYRLAVNIEPSFADAAGALGVALGMLRRWDEAVRWHMEALRITRNVDTEYNVGVALYELRRFDQAEEAFRRAVQDDPSSGELQARVALSVAAQGRIPAAINMLEATLRSNPAATSVRVALSGILLSEGRTSDALQIARGVDPIWWTSFQRGIRCPHRWQRRAETGGPAGGSMTTSRPRRSDWSSTKAPVSERWPAISI